MTSKGVNGTFLVRESSRGRGLVVTCYQGGGVVNVQLQHDKDADVFFLDKAHKFTTLKALVRHLSVVGMPTNKGVIHIRVPRSVTAAPAKANVLDPRRAPLPGVSSQQSTGVEVHGGSALRNNFTKVPRSVPSIAELTYTVVAEDKGTRSGNLKLAVLVSNQHNAADFNKVSNNTLY